MNLSPRSEVENFKRLVWYDARVCNVSEEWVEISLPGAPLLTECDGLLSVELKERNTVQKIDQLASAVRRGKCKFKVAAWWHHSYLQVVNRGKHFVMDIGKAWIDGLARDVAKNRLTPANFRLVATFEPVGKANPELESHLHSSIPSPLGASSVSFASPISTSESARLGLVPDSPSTVPPLHLGNVAPLPIKTCSGTSPLSEDLERNPRAQGGCGHSTCESSSAPVPMLQRAESREILV